MSRVITQVDANPGEFSVDGLHVMLGDDSRPGDATDPFEVAMRQHNPSTLVPPTDRAIGRLMADTEWASIALLPHLQALASASREEIAHSYRGFLVGAAALAVTADGQGHIFVGGNFKPEADSPKYCAETMLHDKVLAANQYLRGRAPFERIVALAVQGPADFSSVYDVPTLTLHPCSDCQTMMQDSAVFDPDCLVVTTVDKPSGRVVELQTVRDIIDLHRAPQA